MRAPRTALVTGASRRIGRAIAMDLAAYGFDVAVHYHGSEEEAEDVVANIEAYDGTAVAVKADLSDASETAGLVAAAEEALGKPLTLLVNNASLFEKDEAQTFSAEAWDAHQAVNLRAPAMLAQAFAERLPEGAKGTIINMIDQRVLKLNPQYFSYTASKSGLWSLTRTMAQAFAPNIRVNAIGPGPTLKNTRQTAEIFEKEATSTPLGRGPDLEEICAAVRFLLESPSITGQMLALDGGQHLAWRTPDILED
ncbi:MULTISPECIES: SDR family oxidoreductase [Kordiimonas]|uniref:NAD(P)-dependent dehydrogenase, short-chain alcohol dehydrogenase family n=1 Tax=Kordiimonas lacus TaxID=637679 RepID=A0A1G7DJ90_9PROT|nr:MULTISPECIES: SDR family oxidoreductase [Kordiimonas]SDE51614.1 NAD(P)-dependent dehydrogenase, short-chain alcohol dehydrogenase family [Kordiimonas lacus]